MYVQVLGTRSNMYLVSTNHNTRRHLSFLANHIARLHLNLRFYPITNARDFVKSLALIHYKCLGFFLYSFCESYLHFDMHECIWYKMQYWAFIFVEIFSQFREKSVCICTRKNEAIFNKTLHFVFFLCSVSCFFSHNHYRLIKSEPQLLFN